MRSILATAVLAAAVVLFCGTGVAAEASSAAAAQGTLLSTGMEVTIAADGSVARVVPDAKLPEPLRQLLIKRVMQWRYSPGVWQGAPAETATHLVLRLLAVPTTQGGFVLRVLGTGGNVDSESGYTPTPPKYPFEAQRKNIQGNFAYSMRILEDGSVTDVVRLFPEEISDKYMKAMDEASQEAIRTSRLRPVVVNGVAVACDRPFYMEFRTDGPAKEPLKPIDIKPYWSKMKVPCPVADLQTKIEGTLL